MRFLVDGAHFQFAASGIARLWETLLTRLAASRSLEIFLLDRGGAPRIRNVTLLPFPSSRDRYSAEDSALLQKLCDHFEIDVFTSTYYTSPLATPMLLIVCDMIPELLEFDFTQRHWMEKEMAIAFARRFIAISQSTKRNLLHFYPEIAGDEVTVANPGYDTTVFRPRDQAEINRFRDRIGFHRPYIILVSYDDHKNNKSANILFEAVCTLEDVAFDILCVGSKPEIDPASLCLLPNGCRTVQVAFDHNDLALGYAGAIALVYSPIYEGFSLPVVEAMACGCPVITSVGDAVAEVVDKDTCLRIAGTDVTELADAILAVQQLPTRARLVIEGLKRAEMFSCDALMQAVETEVASLARSYERGLFDSFFSEWTRLRALQAEVDIARMP